MGDSHKGGQRGNVRGSEGRGDTNATAKYALELRCCDGASARTRTRALTHQDNQHRRRQWKQQKPHQHEDQPSFILSRWLRLPLRLPYTHRDTHLQTQTHTTHTYTHINTYTHTLVTSLLLSCCVIKELLLKSRNYCSRLLLTVPYHTTRNLFAHFEIFQCFR